MVELRGGEMGKLQAIALGRAREVLRERQLEIKLQYDLCLIGYDRAITMLVKLGMTEVQADRCLLPQAESRGR